MLVAATARDDGTGDGAPERLRRHLAPAGAVSTIALGPLDRAATAEMAALVGRRALRPEAGARLWRETEGNPLFVLEAVRAGFGAAVTRPPAGR